MPREPFAHNLSTVLKPHMFDRELVFGEEDTVCHDIVKACAAMEKKRWDSTVNDLHNGPTQRFFSQPLENLSTEESWEKWKHLSNSLLAGMMPLAQQCFDEYSTLLTLSSGVKGTLKLTQIGMSWLHEETAQLAHVWQNPKSARMFTSGFNRLWQAIFDCRIEGLFVPCSGMFCMQGTYVSVTALPPLILSNRPPILLPGFDGKEPKSLIAYMAEQLLHALHIPVGDIPGVPVALGCDGRHYVIALKDALHYRLGEFRSPIRYEALLARTIDGYKGTASEFVMDVLVPRAAESLTRTVKERQLTLQQIIQDSVLRRVLHREGVNVVLLYKVFQAVDKKMEAGDLKELLLAACRTEMVSRVLKMFIRSDVAQQNSEGRDKTEWRLDVVNRLCQFVYNRNNEFLADHLLPAIRRKFHTPEDFSFSYGGIHIMSAIRRLSSRVGVEMNKDVARFDKFASIAGAWKVVATKPSLVGSAPSSEIKDAVEKVWDDAEAVPKDSAMQRALLARACVLSLLLRAAKGVVPARFEGLQEQVETSVKEYELIRNGEFILSLPAAAKELNMYTKLPELIRSKLLDNDIDAMGGTKRLLRVLMAQEIFSVPLLQEATEHFIKRSHVDILFSSEHMDALKRAWDLVGDFSSDDQSLLIALIHRIGAHIQGMHDCAAMCHFIHRALQSFVHNEKLHNNQLFVDFAMKSFENHNKCFRDSEPVAWIQLFCAAHFGASCCISDENGEEDADTVAAVLKIVDRVSAVHGANRVAAATSGVSLTVLRKAECMMIRSRNELLQLTQEALDNFLHTHGRAFYAGILLQSIGRAMPVRRVVVRHLFLQSRAYEVQRVGRGHMERHRLRAEFHEKRRLQFFGFVNDLQPIGRAYKVRLGCYYRTHAAPILNRVGRGAMARQLLTKKKGAALKEARVFAGFAARMRVFNQWFGIKVEQLREERRKREEEERIRKEEAERRQQRIEEAYYGRKLRIVESWEDRGRDNIVNQEAEERKKLVAQFQEELEKLKAKEAEAQVEAERLRIEEEERRKREERERVLLEEEERHRFSAIDARPDLILLATKRYKREHELHGDMSIRQPTEWNELWDRKLIERIEADERVTLKSWQQLCHGNVSKFLLMKAETAPLQELLKNISADEPEENKGKSQAFTQEEKQLRLEHRSALKIQCAWRCNTARFIRRWKERRQKFLFEKLLQQLNVLSQ